MTLKLRLHPRPSIIARVTPRLSGATLVAGDGIDIDQVGDVYTISGTTLVAGDNIELDQVGNEYTINGATLVAGDNIDIDQVDNTYTIAADVSPIDSLAYNGMQVNGSFDVSQEFGVTGTTTVGGSFADNWRVYYGGTMTVTGSAAALDSHFAGIPSFGFLSASGPQASLGSGDHAFMLQAIEGYRIARLVWGGATAKPITLGFWSSHTKTGIYTGSIRNSPVTHTYAFTYTQVASNVPQYNTVVVAGPSVGGWGMGNTTGLTVTFSMAAGSSVIAPSANTWVAGSYIAAPGQVNGVAATSDVFRITGVIVLPGTQAPTAAQSPLIMRPYGQELVTCQRYYQKFAIWGTATNGLAGQFVGQFVTFPSTMRSTPTLAFSNTTLVNCGTLAVYATGISGTGVYATIAGAGAASFISDLAVDARL